MYIYAETWKKSCMKRLKLALFWFFLSVLVLTSSKGDKPENPVFPVIHANSKEEFSKSSGFSDLKKSTCV